jgi:hypothetical protein
VSEGAVVSITCVVDSDDDGESGSKTQRKRRLNSRGKCLWPCYPKCRVLQVVRKCVDVVASLARRLRTSCGNLKQSPNLCHKSLSRWICSPMVMLFRAGWPLDLPTRSIWPF